MDRLKCRSGLTLLEILILIGICGCLIMMLFPAIQSIREQSRRTICENNVMNLGYALQEYHDAHKRFPPSSGVTRNADGNITAIEGWSWIALILPHLEAEMDKNNPSNINKNSFYKSLDLDKGLPLTEPTGARGTPHADALATSIGMLICPSSSSGVFVDPKTEKEAITNYKAMGATHFESLSIASPNPRRESKRGRS